VDIRDQLYGSLEWDFEDLGVLDPLGGTQTVRAYRVHPYLNTNRPVARLHPSDVLPTVAVLPLTKHRLETSDDVIGDILADDIIFALSHSADLNVTSRLSTVGIRPETASFTAISTALCADFILSGNYVKNDKGVSVTLEFMDIETGKVLFSERHTHMTDVWLNDTDIIDKIVNNVRKAISLSEATRAQQQPLQSLKNFTLLIAAISLMHRLSWADFQSARAMLDELIDRSPDHPVVLSWMARWYVLLVQQGWTQTPIEDGHRALRYTSRALEVNPECAMAQVSEGAVLVNLFRDLDRAEERYNTALDITPNDAYGCLLRGTLFAFQGNGALAIKDCERALHLAPLDPHRFMFLALAAGASLAGDDCERALELADASLRLNRSHASTLRIKSVAQMRLGHEDSARHTARLLLGLQPGLTVSNWLKTSPSGDYDVGRKFAATLKEIGVPD
jgi:TolB-like protein/Flp pilus assembly protein TadD